MFLTVLTYLGLVIVLVASIGIIVMSLNVDDYYYYFVKGFAAMLLLPLTAISFIGTVFALIGGFIAKPRYSWMSIIVLGSIYVLS